MQENDKSFLPFFITEPLFIIHEKNNRPDQGEDKSVAKAPEPVKSEKTKKDLPPIPYAGKNLKNILILYHNDHGENLPEKNKIFLGKILHAVNLNFDDVALINFSKINKESYDLVNHFNARFWISFGVADEKILIDRKFPEYNIQQTGKLTLLKCDPLTAIEEDKNKKVLLWNNLKTLFPT